MCSLISLDVSDNAPLRRIDGLEELSQLHLLLLHRNPLLCSVDALLCVVDKLLHLRSLRVLTLPFHMLDARDLELGGSYHDWHLLTEHVTLELIARNPIKNLNSHRVTIADRVRSFEHMLLHHATPACQQNLPAQHLPAHTWQCVDTANVRATLPSIRGVQMRGQDVGAALVDEYLVNLVLMTSVSGNCQCHACTSYRMHKSAARRREARSGKFRAVDGVEDVCHHAAGKYVMAPDIVPGLHYDAQCVVELSDIHGFALTSTSLAKALPLFCNLRRLNLSRNLLTTVSGMGIECMVHLQVLDVSNNALQDRLRELACTFDALPRLVALMLRNNPCMRSRDERNRLMRAMTSLRTVSSSLRYLDSEMSLDDRLECITLGLEDSDRSAPIALAAAHPSARQEMLKQQALLMLSSPPGLQPEHVLELDLSARRLRVLEGRLMAPFVSLRRLLLRDNAFASLAPTQLEQLTTLEVLDVRRNALSDVEQMLGTVLVLSNLHEIGLAGNLFCGPTVYKLHRPETGYILKANADGPLTENDVRRMVLETVVDKYRHDLRYPLRFIDDMQIPILDIVAAAALDAPAAGKLAFELTVARQMQDYVSLCLLPHDVRMEELLELDLNGRELSYINFSCMSHLMRLHLQHNNLDDDALRAGRLEYLKCLQHFDVSHNKLETLDVVALIIAAGHKTGSLQSVSLSHNPCFPSINRHEHRVKFLSTEDVISSVGCAGATLTLLNDTTISVTERVEAYELFLTSPVREHAGLQKGNAKGLRAFSKLHGMRMPPLPALMDKIAINDAVENVRLTLLLEQQRYSFSTEVLSLPRLNLGSIRALRDYIYVTCLDVRGNYLRSLEPLAALPRLCRLDVRDNRLPSCSEALNALSKCDELRHVCVECMSCDWPSFVAGSADEYQQSLLASRQVGVNGFALYARQVFRRLPALLDCDGELNPAPLAGYQWTALLHLKRAFHVGPNSIGQLDLTERNIGKEDFYRIRDWLAFLPVTELKIYNNPMCNTVQSYRYVLINDVRTLNALDGCTITDAERANAFTKVEQMKRDLIYNPPSIESLKLDNIGRAYSKMAPQVGGSGNAVSMWGSQLESFMVFLQVQAFICSFPDVPVDLMPLYENINKLLAPLVKNLDYVLPQVQCICFWGYVKSSTLILTPIIAWRIMRLGMDWERWEHEIVHKYRPALLRKVSQWAVACLAALAIALGIDCIDCSSISSLGSAQTAVHGSLNAGLVSRRQSMTALNNSTSARGANETCSDFHDTGQCRAWKSMLSLERVPRGTIGWFVFLVGLNTLVMLLWVAVTLLARYKNRKGHDAGFWFALTGCIKKFGILVISMSYLPICNILLDNVRPIEGAQANTTLLKWGFPTGGCMVIQGRANELCPNYPTGYLWLTDAQYFIFTLSSVFVILYMVGIPMYMAYHVREAVCVLERNNPRHLRLFEDAFTLERQRAWHVRLLASLPIPCLLRFVLSKEETEKEVKRSRLLLRANALYAEAVYDFDDARSGLYCSYKWNSKYFKLVGITERVVLVLLAFFLSDASLKLFLGHEAFEALQLSRLHLPQFLAAVTTAVFLGLSLVRQPLNDWQDGLIDGVCRLTNVCNAVVLFLASKPSILFLYTPFDEATPHEACGRQFATESALQQLGLTMAGISTTEENAPRNNSWAAEELGGTHECYMSALQCVQGPNTCSRASPCQADEMRTGACKGAQYSWYCQHSLDAMNKVQSDKFCGFVHVAGYTLGVLNILCFILIFVSLLASPLRWWLKNRRAQEERSGEYQLQEKNAINRRRSSILGHSYTHPDRSSDRENSRRVVIENRHAVRRMSAAVAASGFENPDNARFEFRTSKQTSTKGNRRSSIVQCAVQSEGVHMRVSRSSRVSLGVLSSNTLAPNTLASQDIKHKNGDVPSKKRELKKSQSLVLQTYHQMASTFI